MRINGVKHFSSSQFLTMKAKRKQLVQQDANNLQKATFTSQSQRQILKTGRSQTLNQQRNLSLLLTILNQIKVSNIHYVLTHVIVDANEFANFKQYKQLLILDEKFQLTKVQFDVPQTVQYTEKTQYISRKNLSVQRNKYEEILEKARLESSDAQKICLSEGHICLDGTCLLLNEKSEVPMAQLIQLKG